MLSTRLQQVASAVPAVPTTHPAHYARTSDLGTALHVYYARILQTYRTAIHASTITSLQTHPSARLAVDPSPILAAFAPNFTSTPRLVCLAEGPLLRNFAISAYLTSISMQPASAAAI